MARIDHTACAHPRTPAGRRACRAGNAAPVVTVPVVAPIEIEIARSRMNQDARIKMTGATARKIARHAAKADMVRPAKKTGLVVVSAGSATCIQAALHTFPGRCACGWATAGF